MVDLYNNEIPNIDEYLKDVAFDTDPRRREGPEPINLSYRPDNAKKLGKQVSGHVVADLETVDLILRGFLVESRLTEGGLARLIGKGPTHAYRWLSGQSSPSQFYVVRILYLATLLLRGVDLHRVRTIDWTPPKGKGEFRLEYWPGREPTDC